MTTLFSEYKAKGGTQSSLAKEAGIAQGQISVWIKGGNVPSIDNLYALAKAFKISLIDFLPPNTQKTEEPDINAKIEHNSKPVEKLDPTVSKLLTLVNQMDDPTQQNLLATAQALLNVARRNQTIHKAKNSG